MSATQTDFKSDTFSAAELQQFERDGFYIVRQLASQKLVEEMRAATYEGLEQQIDPIEYEAELHYPGAPENFDSLGGHTIRRLKQAHSRGAVFTEWIVHPGLNAKLRQLLGEQIVMPLAHHNCIMTKMPGFSSETHWHQDIRYWNFEQPDLVSVWLALGTEYPENGALRLIPGSHKMSFDRSQLDEQLFFRDDLPENRQLIETGIDVHLEAGDVLFFHCKTLHAAGSNRTDQPKFSAVFTFRAAQNRPVSGTRSSSLPELLIP